MKRIIFVLAMAATMAYMTAEAAGGAKGAIQDRADKIEQLTNV